MGYSIIDNVSGRYVPQWGNKKKFIAIHYLGVVGQNHDLASDGTGAHYYIYWDGTIYQRCSHDAVVWAVGTGGVYTQKHPEARNANTISIELCCKCDGNSASAEDKKWYFTEETQLAAVWLVKKLMEELDIPAENVLRHYDIVNKTCPAPYVHNNKYKTSLTWEEFKARISDTQTELVIGTQTAEFANLTEAQAAARLLEICRPIAVSYGLFPSACAAQTILESGYCKTELARKANNVCGMKCTLSGNTWPGSVWDGKSKVNIRTPEQDAAGNTYYIYADFRKYPCIEDSIADRCAYLLGAKNGNALRYAGIKECNDYKEQVSLIKAGGYATDVSYVSKICSIIQRFGLDAYDSQVAEGAPTVQYYVRKSWLSAESQLGAYESLENAQKEVDANWQYNVYDNAGKELYNGRKALVDRAVDFAVGVANDDTHGYTNGSWGPEYSCISLVMEAYTNAGLDLGKCNIDKLPDRLTSKGFEDVAAKADLASGQGLAKGDVLWYVNADKHGHTEMYINANQMVGARGDTDNKPGDSRGDEISVIAYADLGWQRVFRLPDGYTNEAEQEPDEPADTLYRVQAGAYTKESNAKVMCEKITAAGFDAFVKSEDGLYKIQAGAYNSRANAEEQVATLKAAGFEAIIKTGSELYVVQAGLFDKQANSKNLAERLRAAGFDALVETVSGKYRVRCGLFGVRANAEKLVRQLKNVGFDATIK